MRNLIRLDDELLAEVEVYAIRFGKTMTAVIEDALREMLAHRQMVDRGSKLVRLTTVSGNGLQPGVNLDNSAAVLTLMEGADDSA